MIKAIRIFNSDILFKIAAGVIVFVAVFFSLGFVLGATAKDNADPSVQAEQAAEDVSAESVAVIASGIFGYICSLSICGTAINLFYKTDGCKYARTIKNADQLFCSSFVGSVLLSNLTAVTIPGIISLIMVLFGYTDAVSVPVIMLFSLSSSLLVDIAIRPILSIKSGNMRLLTAFGSLFFISAAVSALAIISETQSCEMLLISGGILALVSAIGAVTATASSCRYIRRNWLF